MIAGQIKLIEKDTDLSQVDVTKYSWDLEIHGVPYQVVRLDGYIHTIGGTKGLYDEWAYPLDQEMSYDNLIQYREDNFSPLWGISVETQVTVKQKYSESRTRVGYTGIITRNGKKFYEEYACDFDYLYSLMRCSLTQLQEHPVRFLHRDWKDDLLGRKVWWHDEPGKIVSICESIGSVFIAPDFKNEPDRMFKTLNRYSSGDGFSEPEENNINTTYLDPNVYWFRD